MPPEANAPTERLTPTGDTVGGSRAPAALRRRLTVAVASHVTEMVTLLLKLVTKSTHTITRHCANYTCYQQRHTSRGAGHLEMGQRHLLEHPD